MTRNRSLHGSIAQSSTLYVFGGRSRVDKWEFETSIESYDFARGEDYWDILCDLEPLVQRTYPAIAFINSTEIALLGGQTDKEELGDIAIFDTE